MTQLTPDAGYAIKALWISIALFFLYKLLRVRVRWEPNANRNRPGGPGGPGGGGGFGPGGGGPGFGGGPAGGGDWGSPPPYSPHAKPEPTGPAQGLGSRAYTSATGGTGSPGFWTGMMAGAGAAAAYNWATRGRGTQEGQRGGAGGNVWERERDAREEAADFARWRAQRPARRTWDDFEPRSLRDEGPGDAGPSRRATGFGGSRTR